MNDKIITGKKGEDLAAEFLTAEGFFIIERNFRFGKYGEIDIIAIKDKLLIFVEVKSRGSSVYGGALYSINRRKKNIYRLVAGHFLRINRQYLSKDFLFRFDLISLENGRVEWVDDIIR